MANFSDIAKQTFKFEGGFQQFTTDTANYCNGALIGTNRGISAVAYKGYYGVCPTVAQIQALTEAQALAIYKKEFWDPLQGDLIANQSLAHLFFDAFIASGYYGLERVKKYVNAYYGSTKIAVNTHNLTPADAALINAADSKKLFDIAHAGEVANRNSLATSNPDKYKMFLNGWLDRLSKIAYSSATAIKNNPLPVILFAILAMGTAYFLLNYKTLLS